MRYDVIPVSEIIDEIAMGPFGSNIKVECFVDSGIPVLNGSNVVGFRLSEDEFRYVTQEKADSLGKANASRGDIVITHRGTLGQIAYIPRNSQYDRYIISQSQFRVKCKPEKATPEYVVYYFHTREGQHQILSNKSQVGVPALGRPTSTFQNLTIPLPTLSQQNIIVSTLSCLDNKIELNNKINANLEAQAQTIFKSWFVDFEPFKDGDFVESELGMIPKDWRVGTLSELVNVKYGKDHKKLADGAIPVYGSGGIMRYAEKALYQDESVLIPRKGTLNNVIYFNEPFWTVDTMFYTEMLQPHIAKFIYFFVSSKDLASMNAGSAVPSMTTDILNNLQVMIAPDTIYQEYDILVSRMFDMQRHNTKQNRILAALRDILLPNLMSGEVEMHLEVSE